MSDQAKQAAIYLRISRDPEHNRLGVERHREGCEEIIQRRGWHRVAVYEDNDITGSGKRQRPGFEALLDDMAQGEIDVVVAQEWSRLERNRADGVRIIEAAQQAHTLLTFVKGQDIDCSTAAGRLAADILSSVARNEIDNKGERQSGAQRQRARQGRPPKGTRPLGFAVDGSVIEHEAEAVKQIYGAFLAGASLRGIAAALSGVEDDSGRIPENVPHLTKHTRTLAIERNARRVEANKHLPEELQYEIRPVPADGPWPPSTVLGILRNPRYAGYSTYTPKTVQQDGGKRRGWRAQILKDEAGEPVRGQWEAIVDEGAWWAVQDKLDDPQRIRNRAGTDRKHLGSGLYRCGLCRAPVRAQSERYRCQGHVMRSRTQIDAYVTAVIKARLARPDIADLLPSKDEPRLAVIREEIGKHRAKIARAQRDYDAEVIEGRDLKRVRDAAEVAITQLEGERIRLSAGNSAGAVLQASDPVTAFTNGDLGTRREVIDALCEVQLVPHPRGVKKFDPETVKIVWK